MKNLFLILLYLITTISISQNQVDALRYSYLDVSGTARFCGLAGAFSALGGDLSAIHQNPAGLGIYRSDEISFSLKNNMTNMKSEYFNNSFQESQNKFTIENIGYVKTLNTNNKKWNRLSFGLTYNRLQDFNKEIIISGISDESRIHTFLNNSQGIDYENLDPFSESLAYWSNLIDTSSNKNMYEGAITSNPIENNHLNRIAQYGYMDELAITMSGAYNDKLFIGAQFGFIGLNFTEFNSYKESNFETINIDYEWGELDEFVYSQNLEVIGGGLNYKIGIILKPYHWVRLAGAYHSKTNFIIEEVWTSSLTTSFLNEEPYEEFSPYGFNNYTLTTPSKTISSIAFIIKKRGLLSLDIEHIDYSTAKFEADYDQIDFFNQNTNISNNYKKTTNIRVGTEWRLGQISLRGGLGFYQSPFSNSEQDNGQKIVQTLGVGYKSNQYFFDCAIVNSYKQEDYYMFNGSSATQISENKQSLILSVGYKF